MADWEHLWKIAEYQYGHFTAMQAKEAGYLDSNFSKYLKKGKWKKIQRGIYRLAYFPEYQRPELIIWSLWSTHSGELGKGVWSHETALEFYDLTDSNPSLMHMTVPQNFRRSKLPDEIFSTSSLAKTTILFALMLPKW